MHTPLQEPRHAHAPMHELSRISAHFQLAVCPLSNDGGGRWFGERKGVFSAAACSVLTDELFAEHLQYPEAETWEQDHLARKPGPASLSSSKNYFSFEVVPRWKFRCARKCGRVA
jgi:hypothetical protein